MKKLTPEMQKEVDGIFSFYWERSVCNEDGSLNPEKIKRELYDYYLAIQLVAEVYDELCGCSSIHTDPGYVISSIYERMEGVKVVYLPKEPEKTVETTGNGAVSLKKVE